MRKYAPGIALASICFSIFFLVFGYIAPSAKNDVFAFQVAFWPALAFTVFIFVQMSQGWGVAWFVLFIFSGLVVGQAHAHHYLPTALASLQQFFLVPMVIGVCGATVQFEWWRLIVGPHDTMKGGTDVQD